VKPEIKAAIFGIVFLSGGLIYLVWGLSDILSLTGGPPELLIIVPVIVTIIFFLVIAVLVVVSLFIKRRKIYNRKVYKCRGCGAAIKLEEKICNECGEENAIRYEALKKLEDSERKIEEDLAKNSEKLSKRRAIGIEKGLQKVGHDLLVNELVKIKLKKMKLITGNTSEGIREWIKTQHYDLKRNIQDIADELGMSIFTVKNLLKEIEDQDKKNKIYSLKVKESGKQPLSEIEALLLNYLNENIGSAFSPTALIKRAIGENFTEEYAEMISNLLKNMTQKGIISSNYKDGQPYYLSN